MSYMFKCYMQNGKPSKRYKIYILEAVTRKCYTIVNAKPGSQLCLIYQSSLLWQTAANLSIHVLCIISAVSSFTQLTPRFRSKHRSVIIILTHKSMCQSGSPMCGAISALWSKEPQPRTSRQYPFSVETSTLLVTHK